MSPLCKLRRVGKGLIPSLPLPLSKREGKKAGVASPPKNTPCLRRGDQGGWGGLRFGNTLPLVVAQSLPLSLCRKGKVSAERTDEDYCIMNKSLIRHATLRDSASPSPVPTEQGKAIIKCGNRLFHPALFYIKIFPDNSHKIFLSAHIAHRRKL